MMIREIPNFDIDTLHSELEGLYNSEWKWTEEADGSFTLENIDQYGDWLIIRGVYEDIFNDSWEWFDPNTNEVIVISNDPIKVADTICKYC